MRRIQQILLILIGVVAILLLPALAHRSYEVYQETVRLKQQQARHEEIQNEVEELERRISEAASDKERLQKLLESELPAEMEARDRTENADETSGSESAPETSEADSVSGEMSPDGGEQEDWLPGESVSGDGDTQAPGAAVSGNGDEGLFPGAAESGGESGQQPGGSVSGNGTGQQPGGESGQQPGAAVSGNEAGQQPGGTESGGESGQQPGAAVSGNEADRLPGAAVSGNEFDGQVSDNEAVSGNWLEGQVSGDALPGVTVSGNALTGPTLEERRAVRSSFEETLLVNEMDKAKIAAKAADFSGMKIACLGDSITAGSNLGKLEGYERYAYPSVLGQILSAEEVVNLGIGGSSYGRYWDKPFCERYKEIPADTDLILVAGGTNDGFSADEKDFGNLEEREKGTFCGDVNELMDGLMRDYPEAQIIFATPLPNILQDYLMSERDYLLPLSRFAAVIRILAAEKGIPVIDLYNSNILDTHDPEVITSFMPDGVHGNPDGYRILAQHMAAGVIEVMAAEENPLP